MLGYGWGNGRREWKELKRDSCPKARGIGNGNETIHGIFNP